MMELSNNQKDAPPELDLAGRVVGDYRILRRLGRGAMAEVFLAEQQSLKRNTAVKILQPELAKDQAYVRRFHREAQAAAALTHANIVQIYEVGNAEGLHFIAQEYVPGQNLKQLLSRQGTLEVKLVAAILRQVAAALYKAAEQGIVHRDIKPENILITGTGEVKVADFGLARVAQDADGVNLTQVGITMGTPLYMSPEQIEGRPLDQRSDIYSLGITCYQLLTGRPPFEGDNPLTVAVKHLNNEPQRLEKVRGDVPVQLSRVIHKMLAKKPDDRQQSASDLMRELRDVQKALGTDAFGSDPSDWSIAELASLSSIRSDGIKELSDVMKTSAMTIYRKPSRVKQVWQLVGLGIICVVIGGGLALASRPASLLHGVAEKAAREVPQFGETAEVQYTRVMLRSRDLEPEQRPQYFASVPKYFPMDADPANRQWGLRAMQQEGLALLELRRYREALDVFNRLANQPEIDVEARAYGYAGQAICLNAMDRYTEADQALAKADREPYLSKLQVTGRDGRETQEIARKLEEVRGTSPSRPSGGST